MYIDTLEIENFKAIDHAHLDFKPGINLLISENGTGKTSVLNAMVIALGEFLSGVNGVSAKNILLSDIRMDTRELCSTSKKIIYKVPVTVSCSLNTSTQKFSWSRVRENEALYKRTKTLKIDGDLSKYAKEITNDLMTDLPILNYQSIHRPVQSHKDNMRSSLKQQSGDRRCGYLGCLDMQPDINRINGWCYEMELLAFERNHAISEYENFNQIISDVMQELADAAKQPAVFYSRIYRELVYSENEQICPISCLSAGYQSVLWMLMDIAFRLALLNPEKKQIATSEGIVLIDDIEMHLHPKWQLSIIGAIKKVFPNIQFIITTTSSCIISSCKNENLIRIDK